jgi:regulatory protein
MELRRRGLPDELIGTVSAACRESGREEAALHDLVTRRFAAFNYTEADPGERRRVVNFLQRRGFSLDCILNELKRNDR